MTKEKKVSHCPHTGDDLLPENRYFSEEDVASRLQGTYIRYKGNPIWVRQVNHRTLIYCLILEGGFGPLESVHSDSIHLDTTSPPLGYLNFNKVCTYVRRIPKRRWKQGIDSNAVYCTSNSGNGSIHFGDLPPLSISRMIEGIYPSVKELFKEFINNKRLEGAFHRQFALGDFNQQDVHEITAVLYYKAEVAGFVSNKNNVVTVKMLDNFFHSSYMEILSNAGFVVL